MSYELFLGLCEQETTEVRESGSSSCQLCHTLSYMRLRLKTWDLRWYFWKQTWVWVECVSQCRVSSACQSQQVCQPPFHTSSFSLDNDRAMHSILLAHFSVWIFTETFTISTWLQFDSISHHHFHELVVQWNHNKWRLASAFHNLLKQAWLQT